MHISIQIDDGKSATPAMVEVDKNAITSSAVGYGSDGGAPKFGAGGSSAEVSGSDTTDIGGPPQWLTEALSKEGRVSVADVTPEAGSGGAAQDGGGGPSF